MVPFAGYELPVLYKGDDGGVMKEHLWCREEGKAAMFDVSHSKYLRFLCRGCAMDQNFERDDSKSRRTMPDGR